MTNGPPRPNGKKIGKVLEKKSADIRSANSERRNTRMKGRRDVIETPIDGGSGSLHSVYFPDREGNEGPCLREARESVKSVIGARAAASLISLPSAISYKISSKRLGSIGITSLERTEIDGSNGLNIILIG